MRKYALQITVAFSALLLIASAKADAQPREPAVKESHTFRYEDYLGPSASGLPEPVKSFLVRRIDCDHWAGEEPYDVERRTQIADALRNLRCVRLTSDEAELKRCYRKDPAVLAALLKY